MKIAIVVNGTRGDVQPMLALATGLINRGHELKICASPENRELMESRACPFIPFGPDYRELFRQKSEMKGGATTAPGPKEMKRQCEEQIRLLPELLAGSDLILAAGFVLGVHTVADILKIPYRFVIFYPALLGTVKSDPLLYRALFGMGRMMTNRVMKGFINKKRTQAGLDPIIDVWQHWMGENVIAACDKELNAVREGVTFRYTQTAYMLLPAKKDLPAEVEDFLALGKPPVFIGFGSNPVSGPEKYLEIFEETARETKQRFIISRGWAALPSNRTEDILYADEIPYDLLFPSLTAIVYHGGTGTMAAAARAGIPQMAFPFMADQFENRKRIVNLGLGPKTCDFKKLSAKALIAAINDCTTKEAYRNNAVDMAQKLRNSKGVELTVDLIENEYAEV